MRRHVCLGLWFSSQHASYDIDDDYEKDNNNKDPFVAHQCQEPSDYGDCQSELCLCKSLSAHSPFHRPKSQGLNFQIGRSYITVGRMPKNPRRFRLPAASQKTGSLTIGGCPRCLSTDATYLGIHVRDSKRLTGAIPQLLSVEYTSHDQVAFYRCNNCGQEFYRKPVKGL
jgi:hypothetical protein